MNHIVNEPHSLILGKLVIKEAYHRKEHGKMKKLKRKILKKSNSFALKRANK